MELMATCLERLFAKIAGPMPEDIVCKMAVSVSFRIYEGSTSFGKKEFVCV